MRSSAVKLMLTVVTGSKTGGWGGVLHDLLRGLAKMELNVVVRLSAVYPAGQNITAISVLLLLS